MKRKKNGTGTDSPEIIVTFKFETATSVETFARYADYSDRESAVVIESVEKAFDEHLDREPDFEKMIGYMKRDAAILNKDDRRTGLFSETKKNMSVDELEELKEKLNQAQANGNNLWNPVISFDVAYMIRVGILKYDPELESKIDRLDKIFKAAEQEKPKNPKKIYQAKKALELAAKQRVVDQEKLKAVVQANMGKFLKAEQFDENTFWWGSVHLNTKHIHIHLSFSELKTTRKMMNVEKELDGKKIYLMEPRGKLREKNIERFKSNLYHALEIDHDKEIKIEKEVEVGKHRQAMLDQIDQPTFKTSLMDFYLTEAAKHLPREGRLNYSSNRKEFREAKAYLTAFVEEYIRTVGKEQYEAFTTATRRQLADYQGVYSKKEKFDLEQLIEKRQKVMKAAVANRVLKHLKEEKKSVTNEIEGADSDFLNSKELEKVVEDLKLTKLSTQEIGKYKWLLKVSYAQADEQKFRKQLRKLDDFEDMEGNIALKNLAKQHFQDEIRLAQFEQIPNYELSATEKELKQSLKFRTFSARDFPIEQAGHEMIERKIELLVQESDLVKKSKDKVLVQAIYQTDKKTAITALDQEVEVLKLKNRIHHNNKSHNRSANKELFRELKAIYSKQDKNGKKYRISKRHRKQPLKLKRPVSKKTLYKKRVGKKQGIMSNTKLRYNLGKAMDKNEKIFQSLALISNDDRKRVEQMKRRSDDEEMER